MWIPESVEGFPSVGGGDGRILKLVYLLGECIGNNDWQCHYFHDRWCDVCCTKLGREMYLMGN